MNNVKVERRVVKKKNKKIKLFFTILIILILLSITVFSILYVLKDEKKPIKKKKKKEIVEVKKLKIFDEDSNKRPIALMYDNNVGNSSHAGLQDAYLTYEAIVEGGLTRIMAIFKDKNLELMGPVRSSRHYFLDYALESDSIYTHYGWSTYAEADIKAMGVNNINGLYDSSVFWRDTSISPPHNVFTTTDRIYNFAKEKGYNVLSNNWKLFNYDVDEVNLNKEIKEENKEVDYIPAYNISMNYSYSQNRSYIYDNVEKTYKRFMNYHIDKLTTKQLTYKNIIIIKVANVTLDSDGRQDLTTTGVGDGYFITNGFAKEITWNKPSRSEKTKYMYKDGSEVILNDGNTFIQIVPIDQNIVIEDNKEGGVQ